MVEWIQERRKALLAFLGSATALVNFYVPSYADDLRVWVSVVLAGLTVFGVERVRNRDRSRRARR